jgi:hypothetical protein
VTTYEARIADEEARCVHGVLAWHDCDDCEQQSRADSAYCQICGRPDPNETGECSVCFDEEDRRW